MRCTQIILLIITVNYCDSLNILCLLPYPGKSHFLVFEPLIQELLERDHNVTVVSFFPSQNTHRNRRDVSLISLAPLYVEVVNLTEIYSSYYSYSKHFEHFLVSTQLAKANLGLCEILLNADVFKEFVDAEGHYDIILVEHFNSDCMLGIVHKYNLPSVGLMSCALLPFSYNRIGAPENPSYVPVMTLPFTDKMTFLERFENVLAHYFYIIWYEIAIRWKEQNMLEKRFGMELPSLEEISKNTSVILVNTHHSLNGVRVTPPSVVEVGGLHLHRRRVQPLSPALEEAISKADNGFVIFSFGSLIKGHTLPETTKRAVLEVFSGLPLLVLWKWEIDDNEKLPENVLIFKWLPQYDLLSHPKCVGFVSHAGLLSLTEALWTGVPMLAIPILGDQFGNAAHASQAGFATVLSPTELNKNTFKTAMDELLSEKLQSRAKHLSLIWKDNPKPPMDKAIFHIEKAARYRSLASSNGRHLNRFQLALIDIVAFLIVTVSAVLFLLIKCSCSCYR